MGLRDKYVHAVQTAKRLHFDGAAEERDGKLHFKGTVNSDDDKNQIWDALKTVPDWQKEIVADIRVMPKTAPSQPQSPGTTQSAGTTTAPATYTVKSGDTLSAIAERFYGNANDYMRIYEANRDKLENPDTIRPGQELVIPR